MIKMKNAFVTLVCACFLLFVDGSTTKDPFVVAAVWSSVGNYYLYKSEYVSAIGVYLSDKSVKSGKSDCVSFDSKRSGKLKVNCKGFTASSVLDYTYGSVESISIKQGETSLPVLSRYPFFAGKDALAVKKGNLTLSLVNLWSPTYLDTTLGIPPLIENKEFVFPVYTTGSTISNIGSESRYLAKYDSLDAYCNNVPSSLTYTNIEFEGAWGNSKNNIDLKIEKSTKGFCGSSYAASRAIIISNGKKVKTTVDCSTDVISNSRLTDKTFCTYQPEYLFYTGGVKPICRYLGSGSLEVKNPYEVTVSYSFISIEDGCSELLLYTLYTNAKDFKNKSPAIYAYYPQNGLQSVYSCGSNEGISMSYGKDTFVFGGKCSTKAPYANILGKPYYINPAFQEGPYTVPKKTPGAVPPGVPYSFMINLGSGYGSGFCLTKNPENIACTCSYCK